MKLQPAATFVIHTGWARHADWAAEASDDDPAGPLTHSSTYFDELLRRLRDSHPDREIRLSAINALGEIDTDLARRHLEPMRWDSDTVIRTNAIAILQAADQD